MRRNNHEIYKSILATIMMISFSLVDNGHVKANALEQNNFENLTENEALEFVNKYNIDLPNGISDSTIGKITQSIIKNVMAILT